MLSKCFAEIAFIGSYIFIICATVFGLIYSMQFGKPINLVVQFFICWGIDQAKSVPF